jgi:hypothetical protein
VRWARRGIWENLFRELAGRGRSTATQMIDSTHVKGAPLGGRGETYGPPRRQVVFALA